jgi:hypothetical protein
VNNISAVSSIETGLALSSAADDGQEIASTIRRQLGSDGFTIVQKSKKLRLNQLLNDIYVDKRKDSLVSKLDEARSLIASL